MANKSNIIHILDRAHIAYREDNSVDIPIPKRGLALQTSKLDSITIRQLINEGVTEFTAILNRGIINIIIEY